MEEIIPFFFIPMKLHLSFGCIGWNDEFFFFILFSPLQKQSSVYVCLCTWNEEWQSTYEATLCSLSLIPIHEEIGVTREDTHTCWTFKFQLHVSEGGGGWEGLLIEQHLHGVSFMSQPRAFWTKHQAISPQEHRKHQQSRIWYMGGLTGWNLAYSLYVNGMLALDRLPDSSCVPCSRTRVMTDANAGPQRTVNGREWQFW